MPLLPAGGDDNTNRRRDRALIEYQCTHCRQQLSSPDSMIGRFEVCPACDKRVKVPNPVAKSERERCSDRQLDFASSLGLKANASMSMRELSLMLTSFERLKHYFYGVFLHVSGRSAADLGIPRLAIESLAAQLVNEGNPLVDSVFEQVGEKSSSEFIEPKSPLFYDVSAILIENFEWAWRKEETAP